MKFLPLLLITLISTFACKQQKKFASGAPVQGAKSGTFQTTSCAEQASSDGPQVFEVESLNKRFAINVSGELCPPKLVGDSDDKLHIFLGIDYSGSMAFVDPLVGQSCKRLEAATSLADTLSKRFSDHDSILLYGYGFGAISQPLFSGITLKEFKASHLNSFTLCRDDRGGTNYEGLFASVGSTADSIKRNKYLYMLTDGLPSLDSAGNLCQSEPAPGKSTGTIIPGTCVDNTKAQASALRDKLDSLNVLFLVDPANPADSEMARSYLEKDITDASKIKLAASADEAVDEVADFEVPVIDVAYGPSHTVHARFQEEGLGTIGVQYQRISDTEWTYSLDFQIINEPGTHLIDIVIRDAKGNDTETKTTIAIKIKPKN